MSNFNRRDFLRLSGSGVVLTAMGVSCRPRLVDRPNIELSVERGWRIDWNTVSTSHGNVAYAIPSPDRRDSGNWVLDTIPLVQAA